MIIDIDELVTETENAWLIRIETERTWLPKSQCKLIENSRGVAIGIDVPTWLAEKTGLV